jgi:triacylglycerol esterase/lipase EstA (alpha/beta hydrolase family)
MASAFRRRVAAWTIALLVAIIGAALAPATILAADPDPVLLVHGYRGNPSTWSDMIANFKANGRTAVAIDLATEDNVKNAAQIQRFINDQGWRRVDIVGQSMGGLSSRQYIKFLDKTVVDAYVSLGTPQYGIWSACLLPPSYGGQMCPASGFLKNLNGGDDTPSGVYWTTIYSRTDGIVPTSASRLDGGACFVYEDPGVPHNDMDNDPTIFGHVLKAVDRVCAGTFKKT